MIASKSNTWIQEKGTNADLQRERESARLRGLIASVNGLAMHDAYRGVMEVGGRLASIRFEPRQWIRVAHSVDHPLDPDDAMRLNHRLPGNLRYARSGGCLTLVADTLLNGVAHLPASLEEIRAGLSDALSESPPREAAAAEDAPPDPVPDGQCCRELAIELEQLPLGAGALVRRDSPNGIAAWEIRLPMREAVTPVLVDHTADGVRLHRTVLTGVPPARRAAVLDQALRLNLELRLCRLAWCDEQLVAETLLRAGLIKTSWLGSTAQAVAVASARVKGVLGALAQNDEVAFWYSALFGNHTPGTGPGDNLDPF